MDYSQSCPGFQIRAALRVAYPRETPWVFTTRRVHLRVSDSVKQCSMKYKKPRKTSCKVPCETGSKMVGN